MSVEKVILFASPVFFVLIALEFSWGVFKGRNTYRLNDAINSISLGILSQITALFTRSFRVGLYTLVFNGLYAESGLGLQVQAFWSSPIGWVMALIFYDLCYYWLHRAGHEVAVFWAAHSVHHQSQDYNLSTALRQTSSGFLLGWLFYLPMALAGVPPQVFAVVALIDLLYQFWVHTEHVGKLGWFDRVFVSPSNHRVHHAINERYLDKNYGGILIIWDRLFGSFKEEDEACTYGTKQALNSWNPVWANVVVYADLLRKTRMLPRWQDKMKVWFMPPAWMSQKNTEPNPVQALPVNQARKYDPTLSRFEQCLAAFLFIFLLAASTLLLDKAKAMDTIWQALGVACVTFGLWLLGKRLDA